MRHGKKELEWLDPAHANDDDDGMLFWRGCLNGILMTAIVVVIIALMLRALGGI